MKAHWQFMSSDTKILLPTVSKHSVRSVILMNASVTPLAMAGTKVLCWKYKKGVPHDNTIDICNKINVKLRELIHAKSLYMLFSIKSCISRYKCIYRPTLLCFKTVYSIAVMCIPQSYILPPRR